MATKQQAPKGKAAPKKPVTVKAVKKPVKAWVKPKAAAPPVEAVKAKPKPAATPTTKAEPRLTVKQEAFVIAYMECGNASQAYRDVYDAAGSSPPVVWTQACILLQNHKVAVRVRELKDQIAERLLMTRADVIAETSKLATFDVRKLFGPDGAPVPFQHLDPDTAACIVGVEVLEEFEGSGKDRVFVGYTKKYKVADKKGALDMMAKHHGIYGEDHKQNANGIIELLKLVGGKSSFGVVTDQPT